MGWHVQNQVWPGWMGVLGKFKGLKTLKRIDSKGALPYPAAMMQLQGTLPMYFERAFQRRPRGLPLNGLWERDDDGCVAVFQIRFQSGRVAEVEYRSSTCATLLGLCEHLSELIPGMTEGEALAFSTRDLLALHPEIPDGRRSRAELAVRAFHAGCLLARREELA